MPQLGISVTEGTIVQWRKRPGDAVGYEEPICDIDTDKIESELPSPVAGTLVEILVGVGETVDTGTAIALIASDGSHEVPVAVPDATEPKLTAVAAAGREHLYSPVVQRLAAEHGIDLATVVGTGTGGRVRKQDVLAAVADRAGAGAHQYAAPAPVPLSRMRRSIGDHMKRSLETAATVTSWIEVDFSAIEVARTQLRTTALPIVASATMATLAEFPDLNAWLDGGDIVRHETVNLGIAVALGTEGLLVPVIREAERLSIAELSARIRDLAAPLLREAVIEPGRSYFDTNTADHHHFFCEATGKLQDIPAQQLSVSGLPLPPVGTEIRRVDIVVRIRPGAADATPD